jgi:hypothetical protein
MNRASLLKQRLQEANLDQSQPTTLDDQSPSPRKRSHYQKNSIVALKGAQQSKGFNMNLFCVNMNIRGKSNDKKEKKPTKEEEMKNINSKMALENKKTKN